MQELEKLKKESVDILSQIDDGNSKTNSKVNISPTNDHSLTDSNLNNEDSLQPAVKINSYNFNSNNWKLIKK